MQWWGGAAAAARTRQLPPRCRPCPAASASCSAGPRPCRAASHPVGDMISRRAGSMPARAAHAARGRSLHTCAAHHVSSRAATHGHVADVDSAGVAAHVCAAPLSAGCAARHRRPLAGLIFLAAAGAARLRTSGLSVGVCVVRRPMGFPGGPAPARGRGTPCAPAAGARSETGRPPLCAAPDPDLCGRCVEGVWAAWGWDTYHETGLRPS